MIAIDPQQELFSRLIVDFKALGYGVYDGALPPEDTPYPFVYLGELRQADTANKTAVFGTVHPQIHVWHNNPRQRGIVSEMLLNLKTACRKIDRTSNFSWMLTGMNQTIIPDNTTRTPLLHGVLEPDFKFS